MALLAAQLAGQITDVVHVEFQTFTMGATGVAGAYPHRVTVDSFMISATEVTNEKFYEVTGLQPSYLIDKDSLPVETVSWYDAVKFCNWLTWQAGMFDELCYDTVSFACDTAKAGYRLPLEAEWEAACRAGTTGRWYTGEWTERKLDINKASWNIGNSHIRSWPVRKKEANSYGLYDMYGNVAEWCQDWYEAYSELADSVAFPAGPASGTYKVVRGGSYMDGGYSFCTSYSRDAYKPDVKSNLIGFRVVRRYR
jgi:formylglycine-generating enzyme required for sulfatase activity